MITATAEYITEELNIEGIQNAVGEDIFWILAEEKTEPPFLLFNFKAGKPLTKDGPRREYDVELSIVGNTIDEASEKASQISNAIKAARNGWKDIGIGEPQFMDNTGTTALVKLNYQFKR